ncbi:MAG: RDD family protein [Chloroflexota bacterium]
MKTEPVKFDFVVAPAWKRIVAFAWDYLVISLYIVILASISTGLIVFVGGGLFPDNPVLWDLISFVTLILPIICYFALQESSIHQATWGKRQAGLIVVSQSGESLTKGQAFLRSLVKFLPWQIAHTSLFQIEGWPLDVQEVSPASTAGLTLVWILVGIYLAAMFFSKSRRTPYDWSANSIVVSNVDQF